nr:unnamed protein product [Callosobruchus analis]
MILPQNPAPTFDNYEETDTATMEFNDEEATVDISQQNNTVNSIYKKYSGYPFHETPTIPSSLPLKAGSSADIYESSTEQTSFGLATAGAEINTSSNTYKRNLPLCKVSPTIQPPKEIASNISPVDFNSSLSSTSQNNEIDDIIDELARSGSEYVPSTSVESSTTEEELDNDFKIVCSMDEQEDCLNIEKVIAPDVSNHKEEIQTYQPLSHVKSSTINSMEASNRYSRKPSARERPTICPICFEDVVTHFTRHLIRKHRNHKEVKILISLKPRSKERLELVSSLRKQGYFLLKTEKNINRPVKTSKKVDAEYFVCSHCLGQYKRELLYKHDKICKSKPRQANNLSKSCLTTSQTFMALIQSKNSNFLKSSRVKSEVFCIMRADAISAAVKNDSIICLYGEVLLSKHKRQQIVNVVSNKMREMGRLLIILKQSHTVECLFDALKPEMFQHLVTAVKTMSGYSESTKSFQSPSLAMHMGTNLKVVCDVAYKVVLEKKEMPGIKCLDYVSKRNDIKDLKKLISSHWCSELSSLALKNLKENRWERPVQLPLTSDIQIFNAHLNKLAGEAYDNLRQNIKSKFYYRQLAETILSKTIIFNRKRVGDVQYLKIENYKKDYSTTNQESFTETLSEVEKIICKSHKRIITGGKGSKPVPILFPKQTQKHIECLLKVREETDIVPKCNPYLFANPDSENRWMSGGNVIRKLAKSSGAESPELLTSTRFRKHIATTLQLMAMGDHEMEQVAAFMGHTKKTHAEFYRLPQDIYQTAKVAKVLLLMEKGQGDKFRGKNLNEIDIAPEIYDSSESKYEDYDDEPIVQKVLNRKRNLRATWTESEKEITRKYFSKHIQNKIAPKKLECEQFLEAHSQKFGSKNWLKIKTFVYNAYRLKE